jgi:hypothetical protein
MRCRVRLGPMDEKTPPRIYANFIGGTGGPFDLVLEIGNRVGEEEPEIAARVFMSWTHAKALVTILQQQIEQYESQLGEIPSVVREPEEAQ